jgi:carbamoyl-phosphate synthase small subunit
MGAPTTFGVPLVLASLAGKFPPAILALADGSVFVGEAIGVAGRAVGEVVFNTAMTGYQEILTDPSYRQQIVTLTYPHIGNTGANDEDVESGRVQAAGLVIRNLPLRHSNHRAQQSLHQYLTAHGTVAIVGIDTRALTRALRTHGAQNGAIVALAAGQTVMPAHIDAAIAAAKSAPSMAGLDLAKVVSVSQPYPWMQGEWALGQGYTEAVPENASPSDSLLHVVAYDFGVKRNILRMLAQRGCRVTVVPAQTPAADALALRPDGIFLSNGPGDPQPCDYAIRAARQFIDSGLPTFGICLGHQIMALAAGARTYKMKFGHHGANHPVQDMDSGRVSITSQNHGFAVDDQTLPAAVRATHVSLFDGTLQGLAWREQPAFSFQGHPEASPGPRDIGYLFDRYVRSMRDRSSARS